MKRDNHHSLGNQLCEHCGLEGPKCPPKNRALVVYVNPITMGGRSDVAAYCPKTGAFITESGDIVGRTDGYGTRANEMCRECREKYGECSESGRSQRRVYGKPTEMDGRMVVAYCSAKYIGITENGEITTHVR